MFREEIGHVIDDYANGHRVDWLKCQAVAYLRQYDNVDPREPAYPRRS